MLTVCYLNTLLQWLNGYCWLFHVICHIFRRPKRINTAYRTGSSWDWSPWLEESCGSVDDGLRPSCLVRRSTAGDAEPERRSADVVTTPRGSADSVSTSAGHLSSVSPFSMCSTDMADVGQINTQTFTLPTTNAPPTTTCKLCGNPRR